MYTDIKKLHEHIAIGAYSSLIIKPFLFPESHLTMHYVLMLYYFNYFVNVLFYVLDGIFI